MRIDKSSSANRVGNKSKITNRSEISKKFELNISESAQQISSNSPINPTTSVDAILALQAVDEPLIAKKKAIRRAHSMLDILEDIRLDLLSGGVSEGRLNKLLAHVQQAKINSEPKINSLLEDIELRARVELAKLGYFPDK